MILFIKDAFMISNNPGPIVSFPNESGHKEITLEQVDVIQGLHIFNLNIDHLPFWAHYKIEAQDVEICYYIKQLEKMYGMGQKSMAFCSSDMSFIIEFDMIETGHIIAAVSLKASNRGRLTFEYEFDQSFIPGIIKELQSLIE